MASDDLIAAVRIEKTDAEDALLKSIRRDRDRTVRGRAAPVSVWVLNENAPATTTTE